MATLSLTTIATLLYPYYPEPTPLLLGQLSDYLDLLLKWNARTNLTAIRDPEQIVCTHFGESSSPPAIFLLPRPFSTLGSGAGFPGLPGSVGSPRPARHLSRISVQEIIFPA